MDDLPPALLHGKLCGSIIDAFYTVYNVLKPGFLEGVYREALRIELGLRGVACAAETPLAVHYRVTLWAAIGRTSSWKEP